MLEPALQNCTRALQPVVWRRDGAAPTDPNVMMPARSTCGPAAHRAPRARRASAAALHVAVECWKQ